MPDDVDVRLFVLHHALGEVNFLGQAHGVDLAADAADLARILPAVGVGIDEIDGCVGRPLGLVRGGVGMRLDQNDQYRFDLRQGEGLGSL